MVLHAYHNLPANKQKELLTILDSVTENEVQISRAIDLIQEGDGIKYAEKVKA